MFLKVNKKLKAGLVIITLIGMTFMLVTIDATENNDCRFEQVWTNRFYINDTINQLGYSFDIVYNDQGEIDGYIIAGACNTSGDNDILLVKTNVNGEEGSGISGTWNKTFGINNSEDLAWCIQQTDDDNDGYQDDGFIIVGYQGNKTYLVKTDEDGDIEPDGWEKTYNASVGRHVQQTIDGGYIITGSLDVGSEYNDVDLWLLKTNEYGNETWNTTYDGYGHWDTGFSVHQTINGDYLVTGLLETVEGEDAPYGKCPL